MRAILSGQAGLALLGDGDVVWAVSVEAPEERTPCDWRDAPYLLADAGDVVELPDVSQEKALDALEQAWRRNRALQLMLILLDREEDSETRTMAAECIDEHFASETIREFAGDRFYSAPLPSSAELGRAQQLAGEANAQRVVTFLAKLETDQAVIARTRRAWDDIDPDTFGAGEGKARFEAVAVDTGAFRRLAEGVDAGNVEEVRKVWISDSRIKRLPGYRKLITRWIQPLMSSPRESRDDAKLRRPRVAKPVSKGARKSRASSQAKPTKRKPQIIFQVDEPLKHLYDEAKAAGHWTSRFCVAGLLMMIEDADARAKAINRLRDWETDYAGADAETIRDFVEGARSALRRGARGSRPTRTTRQPQKKAKRSRS